jgi:hypothetical protein
MSTYLTKEINCTTGEVIEREMTPDEIANHLELLKTSIITDEELGTKNETEIK